MKGYWKDDSDWDVYLPAQPVTLALRDKAIVASKKLGIKIDILGGGNTMPSNCYFVEATNGT